MKKHLLTLIAMLAFTFASSAQSLSSLTWAQVCSGKMGDAWYGSDEAKKVANNLISMQKQNGGWMKNDQFHQLTTAEINARKAYDSNLGIYAHSCFDNYATTQEMRFLVRVYNATKEQKYLTSFKKALDCIITAGNGKKGGWGQYWPNSGNGSYQDYITFNDDLMTNIMKILQDVYENKGSFEGLVDEATRTKCKTAFDKALQCVLNCQVDDNGVKAAWCAQHDPADFLPAEGRPHEEPSVSAYESATLLSYLMTLQDPSDELKQCIKSAVVWLHNHKYKTNAYIQDVKDSKGNTIDRKIAAKAGSNVWGRFIQIGGESGQKVYQKFWNKLKQRNKKRAHHVTGYEYYEWEILEESYDPTKEYQPIFSVYSDAYPELYYRHLYSYEDTPDKTDKHGQTVITSLPADNRKSYQYLGSWPDKIINTEYPTWCAKYGIDPGISKGGEQQEEPQHSENLWKVTADEIADGAVVYSNEFADVKAVNNTITPTESSKNIAGEAFPANLNLRVTDAPTAANVNGTAFENAVALVVVAKKNADVKLYYKVGVAKAIACYDQNTGESVAIKQVADNPDATDYFFAAGTYQFLAGHTYTIYSRGGTVNLYGVAVDEGSYEAAKSKIYPNTGAEVQDGFSTMTYPDGTRIALLNAAKSWSAASGVLIDGMQYSTSKVSNGAQNKFYAPEGLYVVGVKIHSYVNKDARTDRPAYWKEINGTTYSLDGQPIVIEGQAPIPTVQTTEMASFKDGNNPDVYSYTLPGVKEFTFTNTGEQACFVLEITYGDPTAVSAVKGNANGTVNIVKKFTKNGIVIEKANGTIYNVAGAQMK